MPPQQTTSPNAVPPGPPFWQKKFFWVPFLVLVLIAGLAVYLFVGHRYIVAQSQSVASQDLVVVPDTSVTTGTTTATYTSHQFSFNVAYLNNLEATTTSNSFGFYHGTIVMALNNVSAGGATRGSWTISASASADNVKNCMAVPQLDAQEDGPVAASHKTINGIDFVYAGYGSPAAGQFESDDVYMTLRGDTCFKIDESYSGIETSHLQGQDATNNDADIKAVSSELDAITQSFQFIPAANPPPSCTLTTDKQTYAVGDTITLSWASQNAVLAIWEQPINPAQPNTIVPPTGNPGVNGTATAIANITGNQIIALDVAGHGGIASCQVQVNIIPSSAHTSVTVNSLQEISNNTGKEPNTPTLISLSGTIQNSALLNSNAIDIIFVDNAYNGPIDWQDLYWHTNVNNLDNHPQDVGEYFSASIQNGATTWSTKAYNVMPPGSYKYYIFPAASSGLSTSTDLLASGAFNSVSWSNNLNVTVIYPRSGSDFFSENGGEPKIYWTVPQAVISSFPSDFNLSMAMNAVRQGDPTNTGIGVGKFNFADGSATWDVDTAIKNGELSPGTYEIYWNLVATPKDNSNSCTQTGNNVVCEPSAADQAVMQQATQISGVTGWFYVDK